LAKRAEGEEGNQMALRILFADDQIPDDEIPDDEIVTVVSKQYPDPSAKAYVRAFPLMRQVVQRVREGNEVTVARRFQEALDVVGKKQFDVAIIDLGWWGDDSVAREERANAGWKLADAIDRADALHPDRPATAQIVYSARFASHPELSIQAASKGKLPCFKPYGEQVSMPLPAVDEPEDLSRRTDAASQSLYAAVSFIEHLRATDAQRTVNRLWQTAQDGLLRANQRERQWDTMTRTLIIIGVVIIFAGIVASLFLGVPQGIVTTASGVVLTLIPRLTYGELKKTRDEIKAARRDVDAALREPTGR
jgi:hypothetical protein